MSQYNITYVFLWSLILKFEAHSVAVTTVKLRYQKRLLINYHIPSNTLLTVNILWTHYATINKR